MSDGIIALIVVGSVMAYALVAGVTYTLVPASWKKDSFIDDARPILASALWPFALPAMIGARFASRRPASKLPKATAREEGR